jgi:L-rhamnonate dehydratase
VEQIWDKMWRSTINYGRKGLPLQAISAVDLAIWDLLGKLRNEPVWALLGGMTKERCPVYCTTARPDLVKKMGFAGAKIPCPYGPADGDEGFRKNVEFFAKCMTACGSKASSFCGSPLSISHCLSHTQHTLSQGARRWAPTSH